MRGLRTKCSELFISSLACVYDIIAWLHSSIYDSELLHSDFLVYRCDRSAQTSSFSRGGGVLISVRSIYSSERITIPGTEALEIILVKVQLKVNLYVCCLYIIYFRLVITTYTYSFQITFCQQLNFMLTTLL